jgi:soluble lytic murein transglycosylase-like protein
LIQQAHKKTDKDFNDIVAQLYEQEFKTQEKAKYEHIRQAKEKALEEQRVEAEKQAEVDRIAREHDKATEQPNTERAQEVSIEAAPNTETNSIIGSDWSSVSSEQASEYLASKTGVSASKWLDVIYKESSGNPYVENPIGCWGLLQINQSVHGQVSNLSPQAYLDKAVSIYQGSGGTAWATW